MKQFTAVNRLHPEYSENFTAWIGTNIFRNQLKYLPGNRCRVCNVSRLGKENEILVNKQIVSFEMDTKLIESILNFR